jgi:hypothetical protein
MKLTKLALACTLTGALVACGGGGSSAVDNGGSGTTRTLAGVAAKGLIKNGIVEVFSYDAAGKKSALPLVTTRTSTTDGSYSVNLGNNIGLFTIEVSADASTTMADEVSHQDIPMPIGLTLRSLVQLDVASDTAIKGYVTPFTDMLVTAAANASGGLTTANVAAAQTGVIAMLGFNPLSTKPINADSDAAGAVTDPAEQLQSLALAAISRLASDGSLGCAQATVSEKIKCVVAATTGAVNLQDGAFSIPLTAQAALAAALKTVAADPAVNKTPLKTLDDQVTFSQASVPTTGTIENPIAAARALFASLRSNIQAWSDAGAASDNSVNVMKANFDAAIAPLDQDLADWVLISDSGVAMLNNYVNNGNTGASNAPVYGNSNKVGDCFLYSDANSNVEVANHAAVDNVFCRLNKVTISGTQKFTKTIKLTPVAGSTTNFGYAARARMETNGVPATTGIAGTGTVSFAKTGNTTTTIAIAGDMPARTNHLGVAITDKETWNVNFARTLEADNVTTNYTVSGGIIAYKAGVAISAITLKDGSFIRAVDQAPQEVQLLLDVAGHGSKVAGTLYLNNFSAAKTDNNVIPTVVRFTGSFSNGGAEFFNGALTAQLFNYASYDSNAADSAQNFLKTSVSFAGIAKIPGRPDLTLTLRASEPAFGVQAFSGNYNDGANGLLVNSTNATGKQIVDVSSTNGVAMQFVAGVNKVDVKKNNSVIASFDQSSGNISYTDGSFESLK